MKYGFILHTSEKKTTLLFAAGWRVMSGNHGDSAHQQSPCVSRGYVHLFSSLLVHLFVAVYNIPKAVFPLFGFTKTFELTRTMCHQLVRAAKDIKFLCSFLIR